MDATLTQVPFLVSGTLQYQNQTPFTPFVSLGAGAAATAINVDEARLGATSLDGSDYAFVFAWQLGGGIRYALNDRFGLGLLYKYLWTADAEWNDPDLELDGLRSHAVLALLSYRF
jgi:opacity protein-like surface antigen